MKADPRLVEFLLARYADEMVAENQYMSHYALMTRRGYLKLAAEMLERAGDERRHKELIAGRLARFGVAATAFGKGIDSKVGGETECEEMLDAELVKEDQAKVDYNDGVRLCMQVGDNDTRVLIESILKDECDHIEEIERIQGNVEDIGLENTLQAMMG